MIERLCGSHGGHTFPGSITEWPARSGPNGPGDLVPVTRPQALVQAIMFTVDRQEFSAALPHGVHDQAAARYEYLFICQSHAFAQSNRLVGRFEPGDSYNRRNY